MSDIVLKVENLSKQYRLGLVGTGTLSHDLNRWWYRVRGKEDPYLKVGEVNNRATIGESDYVWALKDVDFEVKQGEVIGIIGKNGAGKSTLLKILSKVTGPTIGQIKAKGRIASLLEVGTGFHPELTGRENIFLNGALLGMTKLEIKKKLDEIIDFAGVQRYVDTPVKRYSSGMRVRLGFAVAAFLEPEILIVDEVLAVGDAEFQKRAIGKMKEVSDSGGRTVLFVSHNMGSVKSLCNRGLVLNNGVIDYMSENIDSVIDFYLKGNREKTGNRFYFNKNIKNKCKLNFIEVLNLDKPQKIIFTMEDSIGINISLNKLSTESQIDITIRVKDGSGNIIFPSSSIDLNENNLKVKGPIQFLCTIPSDFFNEGEFYLDLLVVENFRKAISIINDVIGFEIQPKAKKIGLWMGKEKGVLIPRSIIKWQSKIV